MSSSYDVLLAVQFSQSAKNCVYWVVGCPGSVCRNWRDVAKRQFRVKTAEMPIGPVSVVPMYHGKVGQFDHLKGREVGYSLGGYHEAKV